MDPSVSGLWATVLAGESDRRLAALTGGVPKQFWGVPDRGTLLDMTLARIAPLVPSRRTVVVIDRAHESYVKRLSHTRSAPRILAQRCDRGTAAGVLLGIMPALESARDPVVLLTPSDHGVVDTPGFQAAIRATVVRVGCGLQDAILFGAEPDTDDDDYGWITLDPARLASRSAALPERKPVGVVFGRFVGPVELVFPFNRSKEHGVPEVIGERLREHFAKDTWGMLAELVEGQP